VIGRAEPRPVILTYHAFGEPGERSSRFVVSRRRFLLQMITLKLLVRRVIALDDLVRRLVENRELVGRAVVITIDDGYLDNYEIARPILRRFGFSATIFVVSGHVGGVNSWDEAGELAGRALLDWPQVAELAADGVVSIGAHTRTHPTLAGLDEARVDDEVRGSREDLERRLGSPVTLFAYPFGRCDEAATRAVREAGFLGACTTRPAPTSPGDDPFLLGRVEVRGRDSLVRFAARVLGWGEARTSRPVRARPRDSRGRPGRASSE